MFTRGTKEHNQQFRLLQDTINSFNASNPLNLDLFKNSILPCLVYYEENMDKLRHDSRWNTLLTSFFKLYAGQTVFIGRSNIHYQIDYNNSYDPESRSGGLIFLARAVNNSREHSVDSINLKKLIEENSHNTRSAYRNVSA